MSKFRLQQSESSANLSVTSEPVLSPLTLSPKIRRATIQNSVSDKKHDEGLLLSGEKLLKNDRLFQCTGSIEELLSHLGIIKAEHFLTDSSMDIPNSTKIFLYGRITFIQESLIDIIRSITITRKIQHRFDSSRFSADRCKEMESEIKQIDISQYKQTNNIIPGTSKLESQILFARALCRKIERQLISATNMKIGINIDSDVYKFINFLGDYLLYFTLHVLQLQGKEAMKYNKNK